MKLPIFAVLLPFAFLIEQCSEVPCPEELAEDDAYVGTWDVTLAFDVEVRRSGIVGAFTVLEGDVFEFEPTFCYHLPLAREILAFTRLRWSTEDGDVGTSYEVTDGIVTLDASISAGDVVFGSIQATLEPSEDGNVLMGPFVIEQWFYPADEDIYSFTPVSGTIVAVRQR